MSGAYWNREELYELAWSRPFTDLAKEYAISDVGLRKICVKLEIPVPKVGYWAKVKNGHSIPRPPLPVATKGERALKPPKRIVAASGSSENQRSEITILDEERKDTYLAALAYEQDPDHVVIIRTGPPMTALGRKTFEALQKGTGSKEPIAQLPDGCLAIRVSPAAAERAISICEALLAAFERRGWEFSIEPKKDAPREMKVTVLGFTIPFLIEEVLDRRNHVLTPEEQKDKGKNPWRYSRPLFDRVPSGRLILWMDGKPSYSRPPYRVRWADGKRMRIEKEMGDFCRELVHAAIEKRNDQIRAEIREKQWALEKQRQRKAENLKLLEDRRVGNVKTMLERRDLMTRILGLIDYVKERAAVESRPIEGDLAQWVAWAEDLAHRSDPLHEGYPVYEVRQPWEKDPADA